MPIDAGCLASFHGRIRIALSVDHRRMMVRPGLAGRCHCCDFRVTCSAGQVPVTFSTGHSADRFGTLLRPISRRVVVSGHRLAGAGAPAGLEM